MSVLVAAAVMAALPAHADPGITVAWRNTQQVAHEYARADRGGTIVSSGGGRGQCERYRPTRIRCVAYVVTRIGGRLQVCEQSVFTVWSGSRVRVWHDGGWWCVSRKWFRTLWPDPEHDPGAKRWGPDGVEIQGKRPSALSGV